MATTTPYGNPNWFTRQNRLNEKKSASKRTVDDPSKMAMDLYDAGIQLNGAGGANPTKDFGELLRLNSSQINPMSRGFRAGANSSLGQPMNSMYANNPGFFNRERGKQFQEQIQQRNQAASQPRPVDGALIEKRGFGSPVQQTPSGMKLDNSLLEKRSFYTQRPGAPAATGESPMYSPKAGAPPASAINTGLQDRAAGLRFLREMSGPTLTNGQGGSISNTAPQIGDVRNISGKYGSGSSTFSPPGTERKEGTVNGVGFAEMMQGLANKQVREGTWREGDRLPEGMTAEQAKKANEEARQAILSRQRTSKTK